MFFGDARDKIPSKVLKKLIDETFEREFEEAKNYHEQILLTSVHDLIQDSFDIDTKEEWDVYLDKFTKLDGIYRNLLG
jgi:hypothetical protein